MTDRIMIRQGGLRFHWTQGSRLVDVRDPDGREVDVLPVGNVFDSRPADLDEVHDTVDAYCEENGSR